MEMGEREREKTWVFPARTIMAEAWSRKRRQSALFEWFLGIIFKNNLLQHTTREARIVSASGRAGSPRFLSGKAEF